MSTNVTVETTRLDAATARRLTARIRDAVVRADDLLHQAWTGQAHRALGYSSWGAYCRAELPELRMLKLARPERDARIATLADLGMSTRAIADATGDGLGTVHRALRDHDRSSVTRSSDGATMPARTPSKRVSYAGLTRGQEIIARLGTKGVYGMTCSEIERATGWHHGMASGPLSKLARRGLVVHAGRSRNGYGVYVLPGVGE